MSNLMIRNIEAVTLMAQTDEVMAVAAWPNARVAFEIAVRIMWLLQPADRYDAEARWLALVENYVATHRRLAEQAVEPEQGKRHIDLAEQIESFRAPVAGRLPNGYGLKGSLPSLKKMLDELASSSMYWVYTEASQFQHGTMYSTSRYRRNLGAAKSLGDFVALADWIVPLRICWLSVRDVSQVLLDRLPAESGKGMDWSSVEDSLNWAFQRLAESAESESS